MDFGLMGMEGLVSHNQQQQQQDSGSSDQDGKRKCGGSGFVKQEGSGSASSEEDDASRVSKIARYGQDLGISKAVVSQQQEMLAPLLRSADGALARPPQSQMLSFASPRSEVSFLSTNKDGGGGGGGGGGGDKNAQTLPLSYFQHSSAPVYTRNAGYASGNMHGSFTGIRGPFTPAQWIELEHQALIYKYLTANVPVPATLLIPIRKALNPSGFTGFSAVSFPAHSYGWGPFHLGYSGSTDPEPGRCRRTDGKKWRCSRDAVPDQKYCERHINRGRHRSRKPVEGQTGQAAAGTTNPKVVSMSSSGGSATNNSLAIGSHQLKNLQAGASHPATDQVVNRLQDSQGLSVMPASINLKAKDLPFSIPKQQIPYEESSQSEFGFVSTDSLLNPSAKNSFLSCKNYNSFMDFNDQQSQEQHQVRQIVDDWQKDPSSRSTIPWPEELKSDWTQLSMAIPMTELSSSSSYQEKLALSPLRLSRELDQTQMGLGVGNALNDAASKNGNWVPISWGNSMGGPLGEVLNNAGTTVGSCKSTPGLDLMSEGWDGSPQLGSSPTGVLQKGAFVSHSNSGGSGSSPTADNKKTQEGTCLGEDLLGSAHASSSSTPAV